VGSLVGLPPNVLEEIDMLRITIRGARLSDARSEDGSVELELDSVNPIDLDGKLLDAISKSLVKQGIKMKDASRMVDAGSSAIYDESIVQILKDRISY
jgi:hypothetical protein